MRLFYVVLEAGYPFSSSTRFYTLAEAQAEAAALSEVNFNKTYIIAQAIATVNSDCSGTIFENTITDQVMNTLLTLTYPPQIVAGTTATVTGALTVGGVPLPNVSIYVPTVGNLVTDENGAFSFVLKPDLPVNFNVSSSRTIINGITYLRADAQVTIDIRSQFLQISGDDPETVLDLGNEEFLVL